MYDTVLPLCSRFSSRRIDFWMMDRKNIFIFGKKEHNHTSLVQLNSCFEIRDVAVVDIVVL